MAYQPGKNRCACRRAEWFTEGLKRIALSRENDWRRYLLAECLEAYAGLDDPQKKRLQALLATEQCQEARSFMNTTYERGIIQGERASALRQLEARVFD